MSLFNENEKLVYLVMYRHFTNPNLLHIKEDLIQEGFLGLHKACLKYNNEKGKFSTYAYKAIYNQIASYLRKENKYISNYVGGEEFLKNKTSDMSTFDYIEIKNSFKDPFIVGMLMDGYTQSDIAKKLNTSQTSVSRKIKKLKDEYIKNV